MNFIKTDIPEVIIIEPKVFGDERGYFIGTRQPTLDDVELFDNASHLYA